MTYRLNTYIKIILILILINTYLFGQLGYPLDYCTKSYGDVVNVWENFPLLKEYAFRNDNIEISVSPINDTIHKIVYKNSMEFNNQQINRFLGKSSEGISWLPHIKININEYDEYQISPRYKNSRKYIRSDNLAVAYYFLSKNKYQLLILSSKYVKEVAETIPKYQDGEKLYNQPNRLKYAYKANSAELLQTFLNVWSIQSNPVINTTREKYPNIIKDSYTIFEDFYNPNNLRKITTHEWGISIYEDVNYYIVQNSLNIKIYNTLVYNEFIDYRDKALLNFTVNDFRPNIKIQSCKSIFLNDDYRNILENFLGNKPNKYDFENLELIDNYFKENDKRYRFLNNEIMVFKGHDEGWILISQPYISSIIFNEALDKAIVNFRVKYEGGTALYIKQNDKWNFVKSNQTWIE